MSLSPGNGTFIRGDSPITAPTSGQPSSDRVSFLKLKTRSVFNRLQHTAAEMNNEMLQGMDEYGLAAIMESVGDLKATFTAAHTSLEEMDFESIASDLPCKFDATLVKLKANLQREIGRRSTGQHCSTFRANTGDSQSIIVNANRSRLPLLMLPKFSGAYTEWSNFFSMFTSVIDNDGDLTQSDKLQYLRSCLSGAALDTIQSLEINENNYKNALDLLKKRFDNKRIIFQAHIRQIFGLDRADASASKLRSLTDKVTSHIRALQSLGSQEQIADCIIVELLIQKLDKATQSKWEENSSSNELPSWDQLAAFLEKRCRTLENVEHAIQTQTDQVDRNGKTVSTNIRKSFVVWNASVGGCAFCRCPDHRIYHCQQFSTLSPNLRQKEAKKLSLCLNCLKGGHQMRDCKSGSCRACQLKHHTLLHFDRTSSASTSISGPVTQPPTLKSNTIAATSSVPGHALTSRSPSDAVLLATAVIFVKNRAGTFVPCRALLDSGSQLHFITNRFTNQLQLRRTKYSAAVSGIGDANLSTEGYSVNVVLKSRTSDFSTHITSVVVQTITDNQPGFSVSIADWNVPSNIQLAHPNFNIPQRIDLLIGAGLFFELLCVGQIQLAPGFPVLQKTLLGWVISGGGQQTSKLSSFVANQRSSRDIDSDTRRDDLVRRFWEVDHVFELITKTAREELDCKAHFQQNVSRLPSGEYSVRLPWKLGTESLGESYTQAKRRFESLERKEDSSTTKLRVVFDGSAVTTSGLSLNEILMARPTIQPKLFDILIRFRTFPVALIGDICKMYRCVRVSAADNIFQCILWRDLHHISDAERDTFLKFDDARHLRGTRNSKRSALSTIARKPFEHIMADLPKKKCYISVFICFATKAVWRELVKDLPTGAFLEALKLFTTTRAMPSCIWSDNATNFVGAKNELRDLKRLLLSQEHRSKVHVHYLNNGFDLRFIPPRSPHFGDLCEAAVKMAKQHLYRTLGSAILGFDELQNPEDLDVLTPGHFLIGGPLTAAPEPNITHLNYNPLGHWQRVTYF
ncbi:uncharacterized protein LOC128865111 [Anastrepha ludens]|uniref:uncharacterized protein LOC128865111 n=1 Tax=Anastrepha ludens TaxID=28586 RepID=UPI0023AFA0D3|nr:uncharacterized protein LOC128865111 [Anastrepha ludens]